MALFDDLMMDTGSYLGDTQHLTSAQHGAYLLLIFTMWRAPDCSLPYDDDYLAKVSKLGKRWSRNKAVLMEFFTIVTDDIESGERRLIQKKLLKVREWAVSNSRRKVIKDAIAEAKRSQTGPTEGPFPAQLAHRKFLKFLEPGLVEQMLNPLNTNTNTNTSSHRLNNTNTGEPDFSKKKGNGDGRRTSVLKPETFEQARNAVPGYDVYYLEQKWAEWVSTLPSKPKNPDKAFIGFCKKHAERNPL